MRGTRTCCQKPHGATRVGLLWDQGGRCKAEVTVFERRERNDIDYVRSSPSDPWRAENIGRLNFTGVEASFGVWLPHRQQGRCCLYGLYSAQNALSGLESRSHPRRSAGVHRKPPERARSICRRTPLTSIRWNKPGRRSSNSSARPKARPVEALEQAIAEALAAITSGEGLRLVLPLQLWWVAES